jgi:hypothetical protein
MSRSWSIRLEQKASQTCRALQEKIYTIGISYEDMKVAGKPAIPHIGKLT